MLLAALFACSRDPIPETVVAGTFENGTEVVMILHGTQRTRANTQFRADRRPTMGLARYRVTNAGPAPPKAGDTIDLEDKVPNIVLKNMVHRHLLVTEAYPPPTTRPHSAQAVVAVSRALSEPRESACARDPMHVACLSRQKGQGDLCATDLRDAFDAWVAEVGLVQLVDGFTLQFADVFPPIHPSTRAAILREARGLERVAVRGRLSQHLLDPTLDMANRVRALEALKRVSTMEERYKLARNRLGVRVLDLQMEVTMNAPASDCEIAYFDSRKDLRPAR